MHAVAFVIFVPLLNGFPGSDPDPEPPLVLVEFSTTIITPPNGLVEAAAAAAADADVPVELALAAAAANGLMPR